jgi:hypothetical protein
LHRFALQKRSRRFNGNILGVSNLRHYLLRISIPTQLASDELLDAAYEWLCRRRRDYSANADVWSFRRSWLREKQASGIAKAITRFVRL